METHALDQPARSSNVLGMALEQALVDLGRVLADDQLITDADVCATYAKDDSDVEPVTPAAVVRARSTRDVEHVLRAAAAHRVPVTPRAGGTGRVGGAVPVAGGIVLAFERMNALQDLDARNGIAVVEPGLITGDLHREAEANGWFYPPDPNSWSTCTLGGNIGTNAAGPRALKYGVTREYVLGLEAVLAGGTVLDLGKRTRKGVTGYDLTALVVGSEGTLAVVTRATLALIPKPQAIATLLVFLGDEADMEKAITGLYAQGLDPRCLEVLDAATLAIMKADGAVSIPEGARAMLIVELDGDEVALDGQLERAGNSLDDSGALEVLAAKNSTDRERIWASRREMSHSLRRIATHKMSEDVVVPRTRLADLVATTREISERTNIPMPSYGHAGDGNLHVNFLWSSPDDHPRVKQGVRMLLERVIAFGGTLSGEHGIGISKAPYLSLEQKPEVIALESRIKDLFDPHNVLNPGKIFPESAKRFHGAC